MLYWGINQSFNIQHSFYERHSRLAIFYFKFITLINSCSFWIPINSKPWRKRGHLHTYHVTAYFKCNPLFRSILEVDDSLDLFTCLFYTNITLLVVTDWENRNVVLKLEGGGRSPNDEELIVPNWNWWSWLVDNKWLSKLQENKTKKLRKSFSSKQTRDLDRSQLNSNYWMILWVKWIRNG